MAPKVSKEVMDWENKLKACLSARQPFEEQWYYNLAFYFGRQYAIWEKGTTANRLVEPPAPRNRVRLISNKIKPVIRRELAKLNKEEAQFYVVPNTTEPTDIAAARAAESIADYCLYTGKYNVARRSATFWASLCGTSYIKTSCAGVDLPIEYGAVTPFHLAIPNIQEEYLENQPYVIHHRAVDPEVVYKYYDVEVRPDAEVIGATLEQRFFNAMGIKTNNMENEKNLVHLKEIWMKPCRNYPKGGLIVIAGGKVIYGYESEPTQDDPLNPRPVTPTEPPYEHGLYPFDKIDHIPTGRFYGDSVIVDLIPLQKEYNRTRSQVVEVKNRTAKPPMVYQKGSFDPTKVTSEPGQMIPIQPGFDFPQYMKQPEMPSYVLQEFDRITRDMDDISNQFEVAKGRTPPGVEAASAIAYLQEENDDVLNPTTFSIETATESVGKKTLSLVQQFWSPNKLVKVVSKNSAQEVALFKVADMKDNTDIRVEAGSMAPRSRAAKQAFITELMKMGVIDNQTGLRYLQMNETNRLYEETQVDSRHAQRENIKMSGELVTRPDPMSGEEIPVGFPTNDFDNDAIHEYEHGLYMKSQEFELLPDENKAQLLNHYMLHKGKLLAQQLQQPGIQPDQGGESVAVS